LFTDDPSPSLPTYLPPFPQPTRHQASREKLSAKCRYLEDDIARLAREAEQSRQQHLEAVAALQAQREKDRAATLASEAAIEAQRAELRRSTEKAMRKIKAKSEKYVAAALARRRRRSSCSSPSTYLLPHLTPPPFLTHTGTRRRSSPRTRRMRA
jgi:hypothetical protein